LLLASSNLDGTIRLGLQDAVQFFMGSGLDMPFADESFDVVCQLPGSIRAGAQRITYLHAVCVRD